MGSGRRGRPRVSFRSGPQLVTRAAVSCSHSTEYLASAGAIAAEIEPERIDRIVEMLCQTRDCGGRVFFIGVGGGASHASHAAADLRKVAGIESYSPSDNVAELTARINDEGWETAYAHWLRGSHLSQRDLLFVFSVGGGNIESNISVNLVRALQFAKDIGARVVGLVGRDGGFTAQIADEAIIVPVRVPGLVTALTESFQSVLWHAIVSHPELKASEMKWESET
jgi:D-sedoheptulose 7-phosphate isomerase